tara:strand:- start:428 stop:1027 length:600 start_codon:yes stop_codon:yes gene_type:complete
MSFRKEKKYRLSLSDQKILKKKLESKGLKKLYPRRMINSIYFDTKNLNLHLNSEEGVLPRKKIRIRWYGDNINKLTKEIKISSIEGRYKVSKPVIYNTFEDIFKIKIFDKEYGFLKPKILISYLREYYTLKNLRLTFDNKIKYKNLTSNYQLIKSEKECVMEVKSDFNTDDDYIEKLIEYPTTRFSKYSRGILHTENLL